MKFKELIKQSYEDLKNIVTPLIGIPVGLLGGAYILKRREEKNK